LETVTVEVVFAVMLTGVLAAIAWIDSRHHIIPDWLNLMLGGLGIVSCYLAQIPSFTDALIGGVGALVFFLGLRHAYHYLRGVQGLGLGDVKFLAAAGLWVGASGLPWLVLFASISGLCYILATRIANKSFDSTTRVAFGPHLALGLFATWMANVNGFF
jgi:leader peptidase (prepilin peptidase) / N-methyltransferase